MSTRLTVPWPLALTAAFFGAGFAAAFFAAIYAGALPVFVDIEPDTFNINPHLIEAKKIADANRIIQDFGIDDIQVLNGRYGLEGGEEGSLRGDGGAGGAVVEVAERVEQRGVVLEDQLLLDVAEIDDHVGLVLADSHRRSR